MKTKILLLSVAILFVLGIAAGVYWWSSRPQVIAFSDGSTLTLLGANYGKRHASPAVRATATAANRPAARGRGSFTTATDTLVVWVRAKYDYSPNTPNQYRSFQFYVYDKAGTACAQAYGSTMSGNQQGNDILAVQFTAFPRRQGNLVLRVQENGNGGQEMADNKFVLSNPAAGKSYPKWTPEPLPGTKEDDGVSVTLTRLVSGASLPFQRDQDNPDDAMNKGVQVAFHVEHGGKPVTDWEPVSVETTDATGNRTVINYGPNGGNQVKWNGDEGAFTYANGLWPDEPAWKVRLEFTQKSGYSSDEQWTVQNIPVVPGSLETFNSIAGVRLANVVMRGGVAVRTTQPAVGNPPDAPAPIAETEMGGHHIKVFPAVQYTNNGQFVNMPANYTPPQQTGLIIQVQPAIMNNGIMRPVNAPNGTQMADDGMRLSLAKVTDGQGGEIPAMSSGTSTTGMGGTNSTSTLRFMLRDVAEVTNLNLTLAMHKDRFFEFTAKPEKAAAASAQ